MVAGGGHGVRQAAQGLGLPGPTEEGRVPEAGGEVLPLCPRHDVHPPPINVYQDSRGLYRIHENL